MEDVTTVQNKAHKDVIIAEDDEFLCRALLRKLNGASIDAICVKNGTDVLPALDQFAPKILLLDIILPGLNGFDVLKMISEDPQYKGLLVVIISNLGQDSDIQRGKQYGAIEYFVKAKTSLDELVTRVKELIKK